MTDTLAPLRDFVTAMTHLAGRTDDEPTLLREGRRHLAALLVEDAWLPEACAAPRADRYAQHLLHCDPLERFSVVSFVWGPGQRTPVHDHTVWGLVGILRGAERCDEYRLHHGLPVDTGRHHVMQRGDIEAVSPHRGRLAPGLQCTRGRPVGQHPRLRRQHRRRAAPPARRPGPMPRFHLRLRQHGGAQPVGPLEGGRMKASPPAPNAKAQAPAAASRRARAPGDARRAATNAPRHGSCVLP